MEIDNKILTMCKTTITQKLGNIADLPDELANTLANILYRSFELSFKWTVTMSKIAIQYPQQKIQDELALKGGHISSVANITSYYDETLQNKKLVDDMHNAIRSVDKILKLIQELRKIDKTTYPDLYNKKVNYILDIMKYKIEDEKHKNPITRAIQRNLSKKQINEIPYLYKLV